MGLQNYGRRSWAALAVAGSLWLSSCSHVQISDQSLNTESPQLEQRISQETTVQNNQPDKYAVLVSGTLATRDAYDLSFGYQVLLENGFKRENIYILDGEGKKTALYPADGLSSIDKIATVFNHLAKKVDSQDLLFVYFTGHGTRAILGQKESEKKDPSEISELTLPSANLDELKLKELLDKINAKATIILADICYGGGFAQRFSTGNYVGISSSSELQPAHGTTEQMFGRYFLEAYRNMAQADCNKDGSVSLKEAFEYAKQSHPWTRNGEDTPLLKSELNLERLTL